MFDLLTRCCGVDEAAAAVRKVSGDRQQLCHSNDDEPGNNVVQLAEIMPSTAEQKAAVKFH
jgi:hypothetical protein